ncbi:MAG: hypothetical protein ACOC2M_04835 [bacterium]
MTKSEIYDLENLKKKLADEAIKIKNENEREQALKMVYNFSSVRLT